jgi:hypothetical protein
MITELKDNEIFVFGSNQAGIHGAGAAKQALYWGAKWGKAEGLSGNTYAIPTKDSNIRTLSIDCINPAVDKFIEFAIQHQELIFLVTEIGCGLAGYHPEDIAPLFKKAEQIKNIQLPNEFKKFI